MNTSITQEELQNLNQLLSDCTLCPRKCHANRLSGQKGVCMQDSRIFAARAALHFWEEPCISGSVGSGAVFFCGCNLRCVFCQNYDIAHAEACKEISVQRLADIFLSLQKQGAANINLVTPTHYIPQICTALKSAKKLGLSIPIVYNTSGYEEVDTLKMLDGLIDIYLPDLKYYSPELSTRLSHAPDYFEKAALAIAEMYRQVGTATFDSTTGLMQKGMIVRHLLLPGQSKDTKKVLRYLHNTYGEKIYISIMNQYTPMPQLSLSENLTQLSDLNRKITDEEYEKIISFAEIIGIENGFIQEGDTVGASFIPAFNQEGL